MNQLTTPQLVALPFEKRFFDIVISCGLLIIFSPLFLMLILAMLLEMTFKPASRGSFFYSETRISQGKPFIIYKFRIFKRNALTKAMNDSRIIQTKTLEEAKGTMTAVGKLLKQIYLDETPQLWNVLKGDMSIVGPRPTNPEKYQKRVADGGVSKTILKAGITGYFQSHKGVTLTKNQETLDMEYAYFVQNSPGWKVVLYDIKILLISMLTILRAEGI